MLHNKVSLSIHSNPPLQLVPRTNCLTDRVKMYFLSPLWWRSDSYSGVQGVYILKPLAKPDTFIDAGPSTHFGKRMFYSKRRESLTFIVMAAGWWGHALHLLYLHLILHLRLDIFSSIHIIHLPGSPEKDYLSSAARWWHHYPGLCIVCFHNARTICLLCFPLYTLLDIK